MIAIAGAKGGCGKTTTTLGIADAFGRRGTTAVAVDADRQLPNLHVMGGIDRTPTIATLTTGHTVADVAQPSPRSPDARLIPAPKPTEDTCLGDVIELLECDSRRVCIDCPSGAGPDVIEALSAAKAAVVVTTPTDRSIGAAETTIEICERLELPVLGVVCNQCERPPAGLADRLGVEILGTVPDEPSPLTNGAVCAAFDGIVEELEQIAYSGSTVMKRSDRLSTGIECVDRHLAGGVPEGSIVVLTAPPASQAEHLLYRLTATRGTLYLTTDRSAQSVMRAVESSALTVGKPTVRRLDPENALEQASGLVERLPNGANVIVDTIDRFEQFDRERYRQFLSVLEATIRETGGVALLYGLRHENESEHRVVTEHVADAVFEFRRAEASWTGEPCRYLSISNCRFDSTAGETLSVQSALTPGEQSTSTLEDVDCDQGVTSECADVRATSD